MRIFISLLIVWLLLSCSTKKQFLYKRDNFELYQKSNRYTERIPKFNEATFEFRLDEHVIEEEGIKIKWVKPIDRIPNQADFENYFSYILFMDDRRVMIYAPYDSEIAASKVDLAAPASADFMRGYYFYAGGHLLNIEVEDKKLKERLFFTFEVEVDTVLIEQGNIIVNRGDFYLEDTASIASHGILETNEGDFKCSNESLQIEDGYLNMTGIQFDSKEDLGNNIYRFDLKEQKIDAKNFKIIDSTGVVNLEDGKISLSHGQIEVQKNTNTPEGNLYTIRGGQLIVKECAFVNQKIVKLKLKSLRVENNTTIRGIKEGGKSYRSIHAAEVLEFIPDYYAIPGKTISLFLTLPDGAKEIDEIVKGENQQVHYLSNGQLLLKETAEKIITW